MRIHLLLIAGIFGLCLPTFATLKPDWGGSALISKGILYHQTNSGAPVIINEPFRFYAAGQEDYGVPPLMLPSGETRSLDRPESYLYNVWDYEASAPTKEQFDAEFAPGTYHFDDSQRGMYNHIHLIPIDLAPDSYPTIPRILNWTDMHAVESGLPLTLKWNAFQGGTTHDYVWVQILRSTNHQLVFTTEGILGAGALNGTNTQVTIPAGTLPPNESFLARVLFLKATHGAIEVGGGGEGGEFPFVNSILEGDDKSGRIAGYFRQTESPLMTLPEAPPEGRIQFELSSVVVNEARNNAVVRVTRAGGAGASAVYFSTSNLTATAGQDYTALSGTIVFEDGVTSTTVVIPLRDDFNLEGNETVSLTLSLPSGGAVLGVRSNAVLTIVDNESATAGILQFKTAAVSISELSRVGQIEVMRTRGFAGTVSARYSALEGSARDGKDFFATNGVVTFGPGETSKVISINLKDDAIDETNETFFVSLSELTGGAQIGANRVSTATIVDNDQPGVIALQAAKYSVSESGTSVVITVIRTNGNSPVSVNYGTAFGKATDTDFTPASGTLLFGANQTSKTLVIPITPDVLREGNEGFAVILSNPAGGATLGTIARAVVTILDDE